MPVDDESEGDDPQPELVAGTATAAGCASFASPENGSCGSYYCGVDLGTLELALDPSSLCGENTGNAGGAAFVCEGRPVSVVGACARREKSANILASNDELRPLIRDCVYEDAEMAANVTEQCLDCFIDVAQCAGDNCLLECLAGDSAGCDRCRRENGCERPLFSCSGLPDPF
jgi:hypothetical protein